MEVSMAETGMTGRLLAAGRALAGVSRSDLAAAAGLSLELYEQFEARGSAWLPSAEAAALIRALDAYGTIVIPESRRAGAGVRLKFTRRDVKQIGRFENEGGLARSDDVP
jgi:transcriptional regulator with XRE-family HTH domain